METEDLEQLVKDIIEMNKHLIKEIIYKKNTLLLHLRYRLTNFEFSILIENNTSTT